MQQEEQAVKIEAMIELVESREATNEPRRNSESEFLDPSINDASNGLLLCRNCHGEFDRKERYLMIKPNGKIIVKKDLQKRINKYAKLNNTDVPWIEYVGKRGWPTSEQLNLAYNYRKDLVKFTLKIYY